jgi:hypothetical protein
MRPGDTIVAKTPAGDLRIEAQSELTRRYRFKGVERTLTLDPRSTRWYGSLGAYVPATPFNDTNAEEQQLNFASDAAFLFWLKAWAPPKVYNNQGIAVDLGIAPNGSNDVDVYRICIGGKPVTHLPGADDARVHLSRASTAAEEKLVAWYGCARTTYDPVPDTKL